MTPLVFRRKAEPLLKIIESILSYPIGLNGFREGLSEAEVTSCLPELGPHTTSFRDVYRQFNGFSWMDVWNGYQWDEARQVGDGVDRGNPHAIRIGREEIPVRAFGSTGGGDFFAIDLSNGSIWFLPHDFVTEGVCEGSAIRRAAGVSEFLDLLLADLSAFVNEDENHQFLDNYA